MRLLQKSLLAALVVLSPATALAKAAPVEHAVFGGGCFWCMEAVFEELRGVKGVVSGYSGGDLPDPTYKQVCAGNTGHAEVVRVDFDAREISYKDLVRVFFATHDPTQGNRQGNDYGTQYRSVILTYSKDQAATAKLVMAEIGRAHVFDKPLTTRIQPLEAFYPAEDYHQDYFAKNPDQPYCAMIVAPKVEKMRHQFVDRLKKKS